MNDMIIIGTGIPKILPFPKKEKFSGNPKTGLPPVIIRANPRAIPIIPKVIIKGAIFPRVIIKPFINPQNEPVPIPAIMANDTGQPPLIRIADTIPERAKTEPTERSIPAEIITKVCPIAIIAITETCIPIVSKLFKVKK